MRFSESDRERFLLQPGDLLVCEGGEVGRTAIWNGERDDCYYQKAIHRLRPKRSIEPRFVLHYIRWAADRNLFARLTSSTSIAHLTKEKLQQALIPLPHKDSKPDLEEQKRIAAILDKADAIRRKLQQSLRFTDDFLRSVFLDMFGDPVTNQPGWDVDNASDVFESFRYGTSTKCSELQTSSDQLPVLRIPNVAAEQVNWNDLKYGEISTAELERLRLETGDILFVRTNGNPDLIGRCAMFSGTREAVYASYLIRARLPIDSKVQPSFIHSLLCTDRLRSEIRQMATTSAGNYNINTKSLGSLPIILPPTDLQKQFVRIKHQVMERTAKLSSFKSQSENLFSSLQQRAFRGEL